MIKSIFEKIQGYMNAIVILEIGIEHMTLLHMANILNYWSHLKKYLIKYLFSNFIFSHISSR